MNGTMPMQPATVDQTNEFAVVGYDARTLPRDWERGRVCSVDTMAWPSAVPEELRVLHDTSGGLQDLWRNRDDLYAAVGALQGWMLIGVTWSPELAHCAGLVPIGEVGDVDGVYGVFRKGHEPATPADLGSGWEFIGYDVADGWLMSAIWNMGFEEEQPPVVATVEFLQKRNKDGLFDGLDDALAFSKVANGLVPEHAPFSPYGVWVMQFETR